jgi:UDP-glucose:(heptosyl)LPS alpha-1,3-glucosyltransferase
VNIALVRARYNPFGGAEKFVETAVSALADQGVKLSILTRQWTDATNVTPHVLLNPRYWTSTGRDTSFAEAVQAHIRQHPYDLVQSHERITGCDLYRAGDGVHAAWLLQRSRVMGQLKKIGTQTSPHHRYLLRTEQEMFSSPKLRAVICNSHMVKRDIQKHTDIDASKLRVILSGVDTDKFSPALRDMHREPTRKKHRIPKNAPLALFVGSGFERKGLSGFLLALAELAAHGDARRDSVFGLVVGHDKHLTRYQMLADQLGLTDIVGFVGGVDDVRPYYAAADVFVLPTLYDPLPNACLEAMACGLPTITSTGSGAAELIDDGVEGYVTDALDVPTMAQQIAAALGNSKMGTAARARVLPLTTAAMASAYIALYRELLSL